MKISVIVVIVISLLVINTTSGHTNLNGAPLWLPSKAYYRGLNNYIYHFGGSLL